MDAELTKKYTCMAGIDIRYLLDGKENGTIQAISFNTAGSEFLVEIINLALDTFGSLAKTYSSLILIAANEYGQASIPVCFEDLELVGIKSGIAIDDIVIQESYVYRFKRFIPGATIKKHLEDNPTILRYKQEGCSSIQEAIRMSLIRNNNDCIKMLLEFVPEMVDRFPEWKTLAHGGVE